VGDNTYTIKTVGARKIDIRLSKNKKIFERVEEAVSPKKRKIEKNGIVK